MTASSTRPGPAPCAPLTTPAHTPAPAADPRTPGASAYHRLAALSPLLSVRLGPPPSGDGWLTAADLAERPEAVRELIGHDARQGLARYERPLRPDVAAGFGLHRAVWPLSLVFTLPWFLERRVPLLGAGDVALRRGAGSAELTVRPRGFVCLPDDPAAAAPAAAVPASAAPAAAVRVAADERALAAELRCALDGFLAPVLAAFRPEVRRGPRVLWAMATDAVVEGLWYAGGLLGEAERARDELSALLAPAAHPSGRADAPAGTAHAPGAPAGPAPAPSPFTPGAGFAAPAPDRGDAPEGCPRSRASCCLVYTVAPRDMCGGCPRVMRG
ncbi:(2Fe-2S)-binding protein [Kitasatospora sp. NPDC101183]|uniref:(2Fe-2S)-binding protein n=1 Tax=Kitasatospora sp. NPDC101183 TaxID=3364100 RepID=UPI0038224B17